ncbi:MAG: alpha/beta hydrolase [Pelagibacterales bacterium]|nr:alpha/beta hydrolase [Pelagibacterales bacterium]
MLIKKITKIVGILILIILFISIYNSVYFDIPKNEIISKHAKGASDFLELADGSKIHFKDEGNKDGKVLLLVHGFNGSLFNYEPLVPYLSDNYRMISLDLPAHGLTGAVESDLYSHKAYQNVIEEVVEILGVDKFYFVGHSMGGMIAWRYALDNMDRLNGLIIIGSAFFGNEQEFEDFQSINAPPIAFELIESKFFIRLLEFITPRILVKEGISQSVYDQSIVTDELVDQFHDIILMEGTRLAVGRLAEVHEDDFIADPFDLKKITIPSLIIHGEEDNLVDIRFIDHFIEQIPNAKLISYPKTGHMIPMEAPLQLSEDIREFIN